MQKLTTNALRKSFLDFFIAKDHRLIKSDSLAPAHDRSVLFTSAGMNQFKECFLGKVRDFRRATSCQKCLRTGDLEQVGQTPFHHTFFEMLGNFSFGDYFKKEAIVWAWEFLTGELQIDKQDLWVSVYEDDEEATGLWKKQIGLSDAKIKKFGQKENFWPANAIKDGPNGPCGPCSEIYYKKPNGESVEVWNLVFTQFNRCDGGELAPLPGKNIDTGMGLERMASVLQGVGSNFDIDIFAPIVDAVKKVIEPGDKKIIHTIADHARAVSFSIADGILPSNDGRGYVVRKLIRRSSFMAQFKEPRPFLYKLVSSVAEAMAEAYPELLERRDNIAQIIKAEEEKYIKNILEGGSERLNIVIEQMKSEGRKEMPPEFAAELYGTYGILPEFTAEASAKGGLHLDKDKVDALLKIEQERSRQGSKMPTGIFTKEEFELKNSQFVGYEMSSCKARVLQIIKDGKEVDSIKDPNADYWVILDETPFYAESGGQIGDCGVIRGTNGEAMVVDVQKQKDATVHLVNGLKGCGIRVGEEIEAVVDQEHREAVKRAHTATHILQAVLRQVLGPHVQQAGSLVEPDRFRFDFTHFKDIGPEEIEDIQSLLNDYVLKNDRLTAEVLPKTEAQKTGALALFGEKYEDTVRVVSVGDYSKEFCGGTHLDFTGKIGLILITSESSVGSGLRRIEAVTGKSAYKEIVSRSGLLEEISQTLKTAPEGILPALEMKQARLRALEKEKAKRDAEELHVRLKDAHKKQKKIGGVVFVREELRDHDPSLLRNAIDFLKKLFPDNGIFVVSSVFDNNAYFACGSTSSIPANTLLQKMLSIVGGSGGGRKDFAQGGIRDVSKVDVVLKEAERLIAEGEFKEVA